MICPTQVNCGRHRQHEGAKDADRLYPKATQPVLPPALGRTDKQAAGLQAGDYVLHYETLSDS
jgi:hypothetical protein